MAIQNRTKRPHAEERRTRREAFFSESKVTRGEWRDRTTASSIGRDGRRNRKTRRHAAVLLRAQYRSGRWVIELGLALRRFVRWCREPGAERAAAAE